MNYEIIWAIAGIFVGLANLIFHEKIIILFDEDRFFDHKKNKMQRIIVSIGLICAGSFLLFLRI